VSLVVPIALFRDYVRKWDVAYLRGQVYIEPHPKELMLRNLSEGETSDVGATHLSHFDDSTENTVR